MKWLSNCFSIICVLLAVAISALLLRSMFHFDQVVIEAGPHVYVINSAWYEMMLGWDIQKPQFYHRGRPSLRYEHSDASTPRGDWVHGDRFQFESYTDPWGWKRYVSFPHWFAILLLLSVPATTVAIRSLRRRIKSPPGFAVGTT